MFDKSPFRCLPALLLLLALPGGAHADDLIRHLNNHLEVSLGAENLSYSEYNGNVTKALPADSDLDTETGTLVASAFDASWQGRLWGIDRVRGSVNLQIADGSATYNGYLQDLQTGALTPLQTSTNESYIDFQPRVGKGFALIPGNRDLLTPYVGIGVTNWSRELGGSGGYTEQYDHFSWKVGGQYQVELAKNVALSADANFGKTFDASMTSSDLPNTFDLGSTWVQSYEVGLRYLPTRRVYVGLDAFWTHYGYGRSPAYDVTIDDQAATVMEPNSKTVRDGVMLVVGFVYRK